MNAKGPVFKYGDNIDTDVIIPARYLNTQSEAELASHCMEDIDKTFVTRVKAGDIMVGGENFGCGSSREHAPVAIKASGISCVIAKSFARIFYRNAINIGLPILECPAASEAIAEGDTVSIDFDTGVITDETTGRTFQAAPFPPFIQNIIAKGGLMNSLKDGGPVGAGHARPAALRQKCCDGKTEGGTCPAPTIATRGRTELCRKTSL